MAGLFELFTDLHSHIRFRLLAPDGAVLAVSHAYADKRAAAAAISDVRECAGTGLIEDHCAIPMPNTATLTRRHRRRFRKTSPRMRTEATTPTSVLVTKLEDLVLGNEDVAGFLANLTALAAATLSSTGAGVSCGITVTRRKRPPAQACSGPMAWSVDELQNSLGEGPCLMAMTDQRTVLAADLDGEERWPRFVQSVAGLGVRSVLGVPLVGDGEARAVLNLFASRPNAFSHGDIHAAEAFAGQASKALQLALRIAELSETVQNLHAALDRRAAIDMALGVVMGQNRCGHDDAFGILQRTASTRKVKLRDVAASVVASVSGEPGITVHFDP